MQFYKNIEISRMYKVTPTTVSNWVDSALSGRNKLEVKNFKGKYRIMNSAHNHLIMEQLVSKGRVHKSKQSLKVIEPDPRFYEIFTLGEVSEIINDLQNNKRINPKFNFKDNGALHWKSIFDKVITKEGRVDKVKEMIKGDLDYILKTLLHSQINLIELFATGGEYAKILSEELDSQNRLSSFTCIDLSKEMIELSTQSVKEITQAKIFSRTIDPEKGNLNEYINEARFNTQHETSNLIICLEEVFGNIDNRNFFLDSLRQSMRVGDVVLIENTIYDAAVIMYMISELYNKDITISSKDDHDSFTLRSWLPELIGIDFRLCNVIENYDKDKQKKNRSILLDKDYEIRFLEGMNIRTVELHKGELINLVAHNTFSKEEFIDDIHKSGLEMVSFYQDRNAKIAFYLLSL